MRGSGGGCLCSVLSVPAGGGPASEDWVCDSAVDRDIDSAGERKDGAIPPVREDKGANLIGISNEPPEWDVAQWDCRVRGGEWA